VIKDDLLNPKLVFLVFRSRSGSTFFGDRLSRHPEVLVTPESSVLPRLIKYLEKINPQENTINYEELIDYLFSEQKFKDWLLPKENILEALKRENAREWKAIFYIICKTYRDYKKPEAKIVVFKKSGWYCKNINLLLSSYPDSLIIGMVRDPRAVYNSARKSIWSKNKKPMATCVFSNAWGWRKYIKNIIEAKNEYPDNVLYVKYEYFLVNAEKVLASVWSAMRVRKLENDEIKELLQKKENSHLITPETEHLHANVHKDPITERAEKWKKELPRWKAKMINYVCRKEMNYFNYPKK
jgi:hypothetical protein